MDTMQYSEQLNIFVSSLVQCQFATSLSTQLSGKGVVMLNEGIWEIKE